MTSEVGAPQRVRMYPTAEEIHGVVETGEGSAGDDRVYVAVGKDVKENKLNLMWAVKNFRGKRICVLHVLQPSQLVPFMGGKFPPHKLHQQVVIEHRDRERHSMQEVLNKYLLMLRAVGVEVDVVHIEKDKVEVGIVELMSLHRIKRLVVGAAANKHYHKKMVDIKSKTAKYVHEHGRSSCHTWFICKGHLIKKKEAAGAADEPGTPHRLSDCESMSDISSPCPQWPDSPQSSISSYRNANFRTCSSHSSFRSITSPRASDKSSVPAVEEYESGFGVEASAPLFEEVAHWNEASARSFHSLVTSHSPSDVAVPPLINLSPAEEDEGGFCLETAAPVIEVVIQNETSTIGSPRSFHSSVTYPSATSDVASPPLIDLSPAKEDVVGSGIKLESTRLSEDLACNSSPPPRLLHEPTVDDELYAQLEQAMAEADTSKREAYEESLRRRKAEKEAMEAARRAKAAEKMYNEEMRRRKQIEDAISREKQELEKMKSQHAAVMEELENARSQKSFLESEMADLKKRGEEFQEKIISAVELLTSYRDERDKLEYERDCALRAAEELRQHAESASANLPLFFAEFPYYEIENATRNFHQSLRIGGGRHGSIYKGILRYTDVAVKVLNSDIMQGPSEYRQQVLCMFFKRHMRFFLTFVLSVGLAQVEILSRLRHPNIVTLIGACPEAFMLIYEYLPNGSLQDRLNCKDNSSPLSWQTRIRIAADLCSVLIFLHSSKSHCIVHGNLKPSHILLDANFTCKVTEFGGCRAITPNQSPGMRPPEGTFAYLDPEFVATGELTPHSDIYSFGIILLVLLTGKYAVGITEEVKRALDNGNLSSLLDSSAGDWPYIQAQQLAHLGVRCASMNRRDRPNLEAEVLRVVEPMRASCRGSSMSSRIGDEEHSEPPPYFICPIFQEVMQNPHVAADGFTYEAEAIRGWLDSGHNTSPMTNVTLTHNNLVPNHALRSAIQEWSQQQQ
uniref:RING-type E3 ubiquitin transferase n=1 Tax=Kalanchoe fedtschenkoi TaxID=63787 RepID=A0A7N0VM26_KALFE